MGRSGRAPADDKGALCGGLRRFEALLTCREEDRSSSAAAFVFVALPLVVQSFELPVVDSAF